MGKEKQKSSTNKRQVTVRILDQTFTFNTDASDERVAKIVDFVTKHLQDAISKARTGTPYQSAILASLNITEKYFSALEKQVEFKSRIAEKSKRILGLLEENQGRNP